MNSQVNGIEPKYPDLKNVSRAERDTIILNALEAIANEVARQGKVLREIEKKI